MSTLLPTGHGAQRQPADAVGRLVSDLAATVSACAARLAEQRSEAWAVWDATARALHDLSGELAFGEGGRDDLLYELFYEALVEPLAPPWLLVDALMELLVDQLPDGAAAGAVAAADVSLCGLRELGELIRTATDRPVARKNE